MKSQTLSILLLLALTTSLGGCAALVVGGAVTAASVADDRRTTGTVLDDQSFETRALFRVKNRFGERAHVSITSFNRHVLISGEADSQEIKAGIEAEVRACRACEDLLPLGPRPVLRAHVQARVLIVGQAPGVRVHQTGIPWNDPSGARLRDWLGVDRDTFYDETRLAIIPMGYCYPGKGPRGDLSPRRECAELWLPRLLAAGGEPAAGARAGGAGGEKSCIFIYQYGGLSQLDSWDPKPGAPAEVRGEFEAELAAFRSSRPVQPSLLTIRAA